MVGRYDVYQYRLTQLSTGRVFIHAQGFVSEAEFRGELDRWNRAMPERYRYEPVLPVIPRGRTHGPGNPVWVRDAETRPLA